MVATGTEVTFAFGLSVGAGLSTCIGGIVIFFKCLTHLAKPSTLGIYLAISAGVMIFISLTEIYNLSVENFQKGFSAAKTNDSHVNLNDTESHELCDSTCKGHGWSAGSGTFLLGVIITFILDFIVHKISPDSDNDFDPEQLNALQRKDVESAEVILCKEETYNSTIKVSHKEHGELNGKCSKGSTVNVDETINGSVPNAVNDRVQDTSSGSFDRSYESSKKQLNRMGMLTALAVGIHNIPEGAATYIAAKSGTRIGAAMAIGIALHNIPEGIAIATPVYFATGSRSKAFLWTLLAGIAEVCGSLICWLVIGEGFDPIVEGVIFGIVSGVMVTISFKELIPMSLKYNSDVNVFISSILSGMSIMVVSLILFAYSGL